MIGSRQGRGVVVMLLGLILAGCAQPEIELARGGGTSWERLRGEWIVINYWAEWCAPCRKEIPELNRLNEDSSVIVLGVNFDGLRGQPLLDLMDEMGVQFPVLLDDPGQRWDQSPPSVLPSTLIITPQGDLKDVLVGPQSYESLSRAVELRSEV